MALTWYKKHFTWKQLSPVDDAPTLFIVSQWQRDKSQPHLIYLLYRALLAIFLLTTWVLTLHEHSSGGWGIYLTNWGYTLCFLQAFLAFILVVSSILVTRVFDRPKLQGHILKLHSVYWLAQSVAISVGFMITVIFWSVLYRNMSFTALNFFVHGNNSIILLIDLCIVAHPVRILHFIYPLLFGVAYVIFSVAYYYYDTNRGGPGYIYHILDWNKPSTTTLVLIGITIFILCLHLLTFAIYKLKLKLHDTIYPANVWSTENQTQSTEQLHDVVYGNGKS